MGAPGLAFETWDPPRKGGKTKLENSKFEKALDLVIPLDRIVTHTLKPRWNVLRTRSAGICVEDPRSQKRDLGHPSSYPGGPLQTL
jgi:hypothetical protein